MPPNGTLILTNINDISNDLDLTIICAVHDIVKDIRKKNKLLMSEESDTNINYSNHMSELLDISNKIKIIKSNLDL